MNHTTKTFISLATSATMFPKDGTIVTSTLTPELVKARLQYPELIVSALNPSHATTIDAIHRRFGLELPLPVLAPGQRAPQVKLGPCDELFIVQATLPRLNEGEKHSDATVANAPISFLRWRVPVHVGAIRMPTGMPKFAFDQVIDCAHAIALWQRGEEHLQDIVTLKARYDREVAELLAIAERQCGHFMDDSLEGNEIFLDIYLEAADVLYYALCHWHQLVTQHPELLSKFGEPKYGADLYSDARYLIKHKAVASLDGVIDVVLAKYARRAAGLPKDIEAERRLIAPLFPRTASLYTE